MVNSSALTGVLVRGKIIAIATKIATHRPKAPESLAPVREIFTESPQD
ncbi:hypothetical protein AIOL_001495 [Candidatus Rhodobacter oscarellae]|uniref:Uncharacterized protein n=1 Tax=Candidatus Rhodobacter oscarellae TaxID=1675527 RepID=A0A0J9E0T3_9RHOB|nr:hypothetical protein AIOL_001495 [Candidatus Rhodobacter lobularis]